MSDNKIELYGIFSCGYGIIPKKLMQDKQLNVYDKCILAYMLSFTGGGNVCFPSYKKIAEDLQISEPTISKSLKKLSMNGFIKIEKLYPEDKLKHNNKYILSFLNEVPILNDIKSHPSLNKVSPLVELSSNNNIINNNIINNKTKKFIPPIKEEIEQYIHEKNYNVNVDTFFEYYNESGWKDLDGKQVKNWKQKVITWAGRSKNFKKDNYKFI
ncbi:MAG: helix-turn-helix domain-containing protein [Eubacteriales bacterium]|nr:helix-turn-helix domain-containing protein [Eubacteriales bacterium]